MKILFVSPLLVIVGLSRYHFIYGCFKIINPKEGFITKNKYDVFIYDINVKQYYLPR